MNKQKLKPELKAIARWLEKKDYVNFQELKTTFGLKTEHQIYSLMNFLASIGYVSAKSTRKSIKVLRHGYPYVRVVGLINHAPYLSEPLTMKEAIYLIKDIVPTLPKEQSESFVKIVENENEQHDYFREDGFFYFNHSNIRPDYFEDIKQWLTE